MGSWQTTDSDLPRVTINNLPSGKYKATFTFLSYTSNGNAPVFAINDGSTTCEPISTEQSNAFATSQVISCTFSYSNSGNRVFELYTGISSNTSRILNSYTNPRGSTKFILEYFGSSSVYAATANQNNVDVFSAKINNAGDAVSEENIDWLPATCADADPGESTCTFNSGIFTTAPNCVCAIKNQVSSGDCKITASSTGFTTYNSVATNYEIQVMCQKQGADFTATRLITGQFKELMTVPNVTKPKTCYYAFGGASATLASPTECTTGTCVEVVDTCGTVSAPTWATTAIYQNIIFASGTFANTSLVQCDCVAWDVTTGQDRNCGLYNNGNTTWASNSTGGLNFNALTYNSAGTQSTSFVQLTCQGIAP
jgi:hypothetical protein